MASVSAIGSRDRFEFATSAKDFPWRKWLVKRKVGGKAPAVAAPSLVEHHAGDDMDLGRYI